MTQSQKQWGLLAQYETAAEVYHACEKVRDAGYTNWDACTPFPVHGLDAAMGIKNTKLPWMTFIGGVTGATFAMASMWWISAVEYPLNIGGKPLASIPAFIPVTFELTVLFSIFATFFGLWFLCGLPRFHHPAFSNKAFERVTDDKFFILIEAADSKFQAQQTADFLRDTGASLVETVED